MKNSKYNSPFDKKAKTIGFSLTILVHICIVVLAFFISMGSDSLDNPIKQENILIDFSEPPEIKPIIAQPSNQPKAEKTKPNEDIKLVQKSEAQEKGKKENLGKEASIGNIGDVAKPEVKRKDTINRHSLFNTSNNKTNQDTLAAQTAEKISKALNAGHPKGNTIIGSPKGSPTAKLKGRSVMGSLPLPIYTVQNEGQVVVKITVNRDGKVTRALAGLPGTTVVDVNLWEAAREAALKAHFNVDTEADILQTGTITYIFRLN